MYCKTCIVPTCALFITTSHTTHQISDIRKIINKYKKQQFIANLTQKHKQKHFSMELLCRYEYLVQNTGNFIKINVAPI